MVRQRFNISASPGDTPDRPSYVGVHPQSHCFKGPRPGLQERAIRTPPISKAQRHRFAAQRQRDTIFQLREHVKHQQDVIQLLRGVIHELSSDKRLGSLKPVAGQPHVVFDIFDPADVSSVGTQTFVTSANVNKWALASLPDPSRFFDVTVQGTRQARIVSSTSALASTFKDSSTSAMASFGEATTAAHKDSSLSGFRGHDFASHARSGSSTSALASTYKDSSTSTMASAMVSSTSALCSTSEDPLICAMASQGEATSADPADAAAGRVGKYMRQKPDSAIDDATRLSQSQASADDIPDALHVSFHSNFKKNNSAGHVRSECTAETAISTKDSISTMASVVEVQGASALTSTFKDSFTSAMASFGEASTAAHKDSSSAGFRGHDFASDAGSGSSLSPLASSYKDSSLSAMASFSQSRPLPEPLGTSPSDASACDSPAAADSAELFDHIGEATAVVHKDSSTSTMASAVVSSTSALCSTSKDSLTFAMASQGEATSEGIFSVGKGALVQALHAAPKLGLSSISEGAHSDASPEAVQHQQGLSTTSMTTVGASSADNLFLEAMAAIRQSNNTLAEYKRRAGI